MPNIDLNGFRNRLASDRELTLHLIGLEAAVVRFDFPDGPIDIVIEAGRVANVKRGVGEADVLYTAPSTFWSNMPLNPPRPGFSGLASSSLNGLDLTGDIVSLIAPYHPAWERLFQLLGEELRGPLPRRVASAEPFKATDTAVGRYVYVEVGGVEMRIYYESAGTGAVPLLLQHTAGADGRQWRHLLADPLLQRHFTLMAYDLPYHGRSMPPTSIRWWEQPYATSKELLMATVVAFSEAVGLDRPIFMGCSVGGQLALDLAAFHADRFRAFVGINGWHDMAPLEGFSNERFRNPKISQNWYASLCQGATTPFAPEANSHETYWIYRSNYPGIYAGDNDYFMSGHDLRKDGHLIDGRQTRVYVVNGSYDASVLFEASGGAAVANNIPGVIYHEMPGLGHFAPSDDPVGFSAAITPILLEIIGAGG